MNRQYDKQDIAQLLSKFMAGSTRLDEEQVLAEYFRTHEVAEDWEEYKEMFALFDSGEVEVVSEAKTSEQLNDGDAGKMMMLPRAVKEKPKIVAFRWIAAVVASVLLLLLFHNSREAEDEKPAIAKMEEQSVPQPATQLSVEERQEELLAEVPPTPQPAKKHRKTVGKQSTAVEPVAAEAELSAETLPVEVMEAYAMVVEPTPDAYADIEAEMRDIRSRGERLEAMVAAFTRPY
ncbi:MAG: hypothetical protein IJ209_07495 [Bacteroidaceae bacterium]|nr:hypothetical protein [Bacteroidaceae bacterium]